jgi:phosphopantothenoylcysteine decarboxylase/phosphopantothenate--cysteine ligase
LRIIVGVTGGIAAYKAPTIIRAFSELGHEVKAIPTQNALRFIGAATLEAISHNSVDSELFNDVEDVKHIALAQEAELIVVAPATASFIARFAAGIADDLLMNVILATKARVVIAPAMHTEMWEHASTQANIALLKSRGVAVVDPGVGRLTGDDSGVGRLAETQTIVSEALLKTTKQDFLGKTVLIVAGGTREPLDSVRFIGNRSSGKQGLALADAVLSRGGRVKLIAINLEQDIGRFSEVAKAESVSDVEHLLSSNLSGIDLILMPAAIGDFKASQVVPGKLHRGETKDLSIELEVNPDLIQALAQRIGKDFLRPILVGFTAHASKYETESLLDSAKAKLRNKNLDAIVANDVSDGAIFGAEESEVLIVGKSSQRTAKGSKTQIAEAILDFVQPLLAQRQNQ